MSIRFIGVSISDAIDWTQDRLQTTRPLAESVLFSLLNDNKARETADGFLLREDADDEELHRRKHSLKHRPRFRFHRKRNQHRFVPKDPGVDADNASDETES